MNKFELFMKRVSEMPLYVKQLVYERLSDDIENLNCQEIFAGGESFSAYVPTLTYKGENELTNKKLGFDFNIYNLLGLVKKGYNITEISVNTFLTVEETSKLFEFCLDEGLIEKPANIIISSVAQYLSGKIRLGEYLVKIGKITQEQLENALNNPSDKKTGEKLIELNYLTSDDIQAILKLKEEAQKRFVLDNEAVPQTKMVCTTDENIFKDEISQLKSENKKLKAQLNKLLEFVK